MKLGKILKKRDGLPGWGLHDFGFRTLLGNLRGKPCLGIGIPVNQEDAGGLNFITGPAKDILAGGVGGEVEVTNLATDGHPTRIAPVNRAPLPGLAQKSGRGGGVRVTDKKDGVVFARKEEPRDGVTGGIGSHHS